MRWLILRAFVHRWRVGLAIGAIAFSGLAAWTLLSPRKYEANLKILVKNERPQALMSPAPGQGAVVRADVGQERINSEIELLTSADLLSVVVSECRLDAMEQRRGVKSERSAAVALRGLRKDLSVRPVRNSNVIEVAYKSSDPQMALAVLQALEKLYLDSHLRVHQTPGAFDFFDRQAEELHGSLNDAESERTGFLGEWKLTEISRQKELTLQRREAAKSEFEAADARLAESRARKGSLASQLQDLDPRVVTSRRTLPNQYSVERLHTLIAELGNERTRLLTRLYPDDRLVVEVEQQIAQTRAALEEAQAFSAVEEQTEANPLQQQLLLDLARADVEVSALAARRDAIAASVSSAEERLAVLERMTAPYNELERRVERAEEAFLLYARKREEARVSELLDSQKFGNVAIAEAPRLPVLPSAPNVPLNLAIGMVLAGLLGAGASVGREATAQVVRSQRQISQSTNLPILGVIPSGGD